MVSLLVPSDVIESTDQRRHGFPFRSGHIVLDFVATVAKRDAAQAEVADRELLTDAGALIDWVHVAGLPAITTSVSAAHLRRARELREAINRLTRARVHGTVHDTADVDLINSMARSATPSTQLDPSATAAIPSDAVATPAILALLAREAVDLFAGEYSDRIRLCRGHDCSLYFVDRSRVGNRTWCSMSACGVKNSSARYRARRRIAPPASAHPAPRSAIDDSVKEGIR